MMILRWLVTILALSLRMAVAQPCYTDIDKCQACLMTFCPYNVGPPSFPTLRFPGRDVSAACPNLAQIGAMPACNQTTDDCGRTTIWCRAASIRYTGIDCSTGMMVSQTAVTCCGIEGIQWPAAIKPSAKERIAQ